MYICICIIIYAYIEIYNQPDESVFVLYVYINSGLATVPWLTNKETYLWEGLILGPAVISCLWLFVCGWPQDILFLPCQHVHWYCIVPVLLSQLFLGDSVPQLTSWSSGSYSLFTLYSACSLSHRGRSWDIDVSIEVGLPVICWSLCCVQCVCVCVVIVSICCKQRLLWCDLATPYTCLGV